ncbi:hypothetical protein PhCBS80983_g03401 [Powellomyces hirtus]|uniref:Sulfotransferase family protein n=1 Tax=Powellomyces hirtus TaxID=109895 RepID=A0A507E2X2_9FUNG|nr:hypothetical protein PhCBS80983_g03401 [Powellomyces hirtus]
MSLEIIGAGFGRTGTKSLQLALEKLGFPCYHMTTVFQNLGDIATWEAASAGKDVDWEVLLGNYKATVDWPGCDHWKKLMERYPDAKVILGVRDEEKWYQSCMESIYRISRVPEELTKSNAGLHAVQKFTNQAVWGPSGTFQGKFADKEFALNVFRSHIAEVKCTVPADKLLVFEVAQGWAPLCAFLGVPIPQEEFPRVNDKESFGAMIDMIEKGEEIPHVHPGREQQSE